MRELTQTDEHGGFIIPKELQEEFEIALSMPVYPPQPEGTKLRFALGLISGDIICPPAANEEEADGK